MLAIAMKVKQGFFFIGRKLKSAWAWIVLLLVLVSLLLYSLRRKPKPEPIVASGDIPTATEAVIQKIPAAVMEAKIEKAIIEAKTEAAKAELVEIQNVPDGVERRKRLAAYLNKSI